MTEKYGLERTEIADICNHTEALIEAAGGPKRVAHMLGVTLQTVYRYCHPDNESYMPLLAMIRLERHIVNNLDKSPAFGPAYLQDMGFYTTRQDKADLPENPLEAAMQAMNCDGKAISVIADAVKDGKITPREASTAIPVLQEDNATTQALIERLKQIATA